MMNQPKEFTLRGYFEAIRRRWWLIVILALVGAGVGYGYASLQKTGYSATSSLTVNDPNQSLVIFGGNFVSGKTPLQEASAAASQVTRPEVVTGVERLLGRSANASDVSVSVDPNSYVVNINASSGKSGSEAAAVANAFADVDTSLTTSEVRKHYGDQATTIAKQARSLKHVPPTLALASIETYTRLQGLSKVATPMAVTQRAVAGSPSSGKLRDTLVGLLVGLLLGIAAATTWDALDRRLRHTGEVAEALDHPVIGHIRASALGHVGTPAESLNGLGPLEDPDQESFRILRENVAYLGVAPKSVVLVTSATAEEGKSTVAACLAVAMAEAGKRTLLVECDLRKPVLAHRFHINQGPGLTDYLTGNAQPHEILQPVAGIAPPLNGNGPAHAAAPNLVCITAGTTVSRPAALLASNRFQTFLTEVSEVYDAVLLDTAPLLSVADTLAIVPAASLLLVCVRLDRTKRDQLRAARTALERLPERPVGVVLTGVRSERDGYYDFYGAVKPSTALSTSA